MAWRNPWYVDTVPEVDPFIEGLKEKGCHYNEDEDPAWIPYNTLLAMQSINE